MKKYLLPLILILILCLAFSVNVMANVETLRPNGVGNETAIPNQQPDSTFHWDKVDEESADTDTYVWASGSGEWRDLYALPAHSLGSGTINKVTVYIRCYAYDPGGSDPHAKVSMRTGGVTYDGDYIDLYCTPWTTYSYEWTSNPGNAHAWTWDEIDVLEIGVLLGGDAPDTEYCTQVYVEIDYTPPAEVNVIFFSTPF